MVFKTLYIPNYFDEKESREMYKYLKKNVKWEEEVTSKGKHTRYAKAMKLEDDEKVKNMIERVYLLLNKNVAILGVYLNYYKNGNDYTPSHRHPKQIQCVISLGKGRKFILGKKEYKLSNGDVIFFDSSSHSVPKSKTKRGQISIATFSVEINDSIEKLIKGLR